MDEEIKMNAEEEYTEYEQQAEEKLDSFYEENKAEAEAILNDVDKMEELMQKLEKKLKTVPIAGNSLSYIPLMMSLVRSYVKKEYTDIPIASMIAIVIALLYFLSPVDLIPDPLPVIGYVDDAVVITGCLALIKTDLADYKNWRKESGREIENIPDYEDIEKEAGNLSKYAKAFFRGRDSAK